MKSMAGDRFGKCFCSSQSMLCQCFLAGCCLESEMGFLISMIVLGLHDKVLVFCVGYGNGYSEDLLGASSYPMEPIPAGFRIDPPLPKAKPISSRGSTSEITD